MSSSMQSLLYNKPSPSSNPAHSSIVPSSNPSFCSIHSQKSKIQSSSIMHLQSYLSRNAIVSSSSTIMSMKSNDYVCHKCCKVYKRMVKQLRFYSTKKRRVSTSRWAKPNEEDISNCKATLMNWSQLFYNMILLYWLSMHSSHWLAAMLDMTSQTML